MAKSKVKYRTRTVTRIRRVGSRVKHHVKKAKPSIAILGGLSVGPVEAIFGSNDSYGVKGSIWNVSGNKAAELWNRIQITYTGGQMGGSGGYQFSRAHGSIAAIAGFGVHWLATITGANRYLARMKMPFRI